MDLRVGLYHHDDTARHWCRIRIKVRLFCRNKHNTIGRIYKKKLGLRIENKFNTIALYPLNINLTIACLHDQNKSGFFGEPAFSSQSGLFENFSDCSDWLDKSRPYKKATFVLIM